MRLQAFGFAQRNGRRTKRAQAFGAALQERRALDEIIHAKA
jgi:hypothetical protein